jgi:hypothetical protein
MLSLVCGNFQQLVDDQLNDACDLTTPLSDDDVAMMAIDGIRAQGASISSVLEQSVFLYNNE